MNVKMTRLLDGAACAYIDEINRALRTLSEDELAEFAAEPVESKLDTTWSHEAYCKRAAKLLLMWKATFKEAEEVMARPNFSGMYCVYHKCDSKDCSAQHDECSCQKEVK